MKHFSWAMVYQLVLGALLISGAVVWGWQLGQGGFSLNSSLDRWLLGNWASVATSSSATTTATSVIVMKSNVPPVFKNSPACDQLGATSSVDNLVTDWSLDKPLECRLVIGGSEASTTFIIKKDAARTVPGFSFPKYVVEIYNPISGSLAQRIKIDPGLSEERSNFSPDFFNLRADVNFDGYRDAFVLDNLGATNQLSGWWLYNPVTSKFEKSDQLSSLPNPQFSAADQTISTYTSNGAAGCLFNRSWLQFKQSKYEEVRREQQTGGAGKSGDGFKRVLEVMTAGRWRVASTTILTASNCFN